MHQHFCGWWGRTDVQVVAGYHADDMPSTGKLLQIILEYGRFYGQIVHEILKGIYALALELTSQL